MVRILLSTKSRMIDTVGMFRMGDERTLYLAVQNEREWARLCRQVLDRPDLVADARFHSNPERVAHREELTAIIEERFAHLSAEQVIARLEQAQIAYAHLNSMQEFCQHPQLAAQSLA